jgi:hypothetical protein
MLKIKQPSKFQVLWEPLQFCINLISQYLQTSKDSLISYQTLVINKKCNSNSKSLGRAFYKSKKIILHLYYPSFPLMGKRHLLWIKWIRYKVLDKKDKRYIGNCLCNRLLWVWRKRKGMLRSTLQTQRLWCKELI